MTIVFLSFIYFSRFIQQRENLLCQTGVWLWERGESGEIKNNMEVRKDLNTITFLGHWLVYFFCLWERSKEKQNTALVNFLHFFLLNLQTMYI